MFAYCNNNPILASDPDGRWLNIVIGAVVGFATSFVSSVVTDVVTGNEIDWGGAFISGGVGAVTGALVAAVPTCAAGINAVTSAAESVINDVRHGEDFKTIAINATVSAGFGAVTGSFGSEFSNTNLYDDAIKSVPKALKKGIHPIVKKAAKKTVRKAVKSIGKAILSGTGESITYGLLSKGTRAYLNLVF